MADDLSAHNGEAPGPEAGGAGAYQVLARKYRPQTLQELIGQESLVAVLKAAFEQNRMPHAIMLTGVRGVGKTTTARIVAKGLNCLAAEGPTITPCGKCDNCVAIAASRHVDVLEMDAASRTGIDDIREIIDSVRYRAAQARYKVYIIDEVHMLSKNAFNGLLKTLEEPPPHVKFILATTDIHKVPVTVLSRCMRFDLPRVSATDLIAHLRGICEKEGAPAEDEGLAAVAQAAGGSVRDSLSLLDQAISYGGAGGVTGEGVRDMLGLADRGKLIELFEQVMRGQSAEALAGFRALYDAGGDPEGVLEGLSEVCHLATVVKIAPERADDPSLPHADREASRRLADALPMRALSRAWQILLKGMEEVSRAPSAAMAAEMVLIRLSHVADLPSPEELLKKLTLEEGPTHRPAGGGGPSAGGASGGGAQAAQKNVQAAAAGGPLALVANAAPARQSAPPMQAQAKAKDVIELKDFDAIVQLLRARREAKLMIDVERFVRPGPVRPGAFEFTPAQGAPAELAAELGRKLSEWTRRRWVVSIADGHTGQTLDEARNAAMDDLRAQALEHALVRAALTAFPGAELTSVRDLTAAPVAEPTFDDDALLAEDDDDDFDEGRFAPASAYESDQFD